jgi:Xaa-Pro aminopeptidase
MSIFKKRIKSLASHLSKTDVAVISGNPSRIRSNDTLYASFRNSDLLYFTGSENQDLTLIVSGSGSVTLVAPKPDPEKALWDGTGEDPKSVSRRIGSKLTLTESISSELKKLIEGHETLYYQPIDGTPSFNLAASIFNKPYYLRRVLPKNLVPLEVVSSKLRLIKTSDEISKISEAVQVTAYSFYECLRFLIPGVTERFIASSIEYWIKAQGGDLSFNTIVASGENASVLHFSPSERKLKKGELVLIDFGGSVDGYCADVTRTVPVGGDSIPQKLVDIYHIVLEAQEAAIEHVKAGVLLSDVYKVAATVIIKGLMAIKLLKKGSVSSHLKDKTYKKYFPHSIGHSLGLDVHDVGPLRESAENELKEGMVITIEPGVYISGALGVRIEDDLLVTKKGSVNLTDSIPKDINVLAALVRGEIEVGQTDPDLPSNR